MGASDLHLKVPSPPRVRIDGMLRDLDGAAPLRPGHTEDLAMQVLRSEPKREQFTRDGSVEVSYYTEHGRFRASVFRQRGSVALIFRVITEAPEPDGLGIPQVVLDWSRSIH